MPGKLEKKRNSKVTNVGNEKWDITKDLIAIKMVIGHTIKTLCQYI